MEFNKKYFILIILFVFFVFLNNVSASDTNEMNVTLDSDVHEIELTENNVIGMDDNKLNSDNSEDIVVNDWDELQYYCSLSDKDYTLKLKEDTNYYPSDPSSSTNQIKINNNVKIIGASGAYIGDELPRNVYVAQGTYKIETGNFIEFTPIIVSDSVKKGVIFENVAFKWTYIKNVQSDGIFIEINGGSKNSFNNCTVNQGFFSGHAASFLHLKKGIHIFNF